mmetsp:Transcript_22446/g.62643  ORF Transcript_22446/g.62643 Transcript_22446/m.62643 type:complete len:173 (-) Transcript_22446:401-919(-)|eukprot:CAMPEP_0198121786 /NCGR_PEP_ID=MMETSP1442-20131203/33063_1 /TAXON_ID= /ORGANISM="Craspedostauros australis, Strain CCMP3328" /LENGTH=172 /DNA_ID=CAMNT_0043780659 /DNA_START=373 /DNA_END=891 /DNA_ORIENTATION=+
MARDVDERHVHDGALGVDIRGLFTTRNNSHVNFSNNDSNDNNDTSERRTECTIPLRTTGRIQYERRAAQQYSQNVDTMPSTRTPLLLLAACLLSSATAKPRIPLYLENLDPNDPAPIIGGAASEAMMNNNEGFDRSGEYMRIHKLQLQRKQKEEADRRRALYIRSHPHNNEQ